MLSHVECVDVDNPLTLRIILTRDCLPHFSPSLTGKKSNEILQGGLSSIKNAATSVAKKLDEIKEAISANTTPVKTGSGTINGVGGLDRDVHGSESDLLNEDGINGNRSRRVSSEFDLWGRFSESRKSSYNNLVPLGENTTSNNSLNTYPTLPDNVYTAVAEVGFPKIYFTELALEAFLLNPFRFRNRTSPISSYRSHPARSVTTVRCYCTTRM